MKYFQEMAPVLVGEVNAQIAEHPELWGQFGWRKDDPSMVHAGMTDIWVRYNDIRKFKQFDESFNARHVPVWYPAWRKLPGLKPIIRELMYAVEGEMLGGVLITKIPSGHRIEPHVDTGWHVEYYDKFYISLSSHPGAEFHCGGETINPKTGDCYRFDNRREHWVANDSEYDRVTLIICIRTEFFKNEREQFARAR